MKELVKYVAYARVALGSALLMTIVTVGFSHCGNMNSFNLGRSLTVTFLAFGVFWIFYSLLGYINARFSKPHLKIAEIKRFLLQEGFVFYKDEYLEGYIENYYCVVYSELYHWQLTFEIHLTPQVTFNFKKMKKLLKKKDVEIDKEDGKVILSQSLGTIYESLNDLKSNLIEITHLIHQSRTA